MDDFKSKMRQLSLSEREVQIQIGFAKRMMHSVSEVMDKSMKSERYRKLVKAGKVVEDVGLIDDYIENNLYLVLQANAEFIRGRSLSMVTDRKKIVR